MTNFLEQLFATARFRLGILTTFDLLDLLLVALVYYALLGFIRRSKAAALLRGILVLLLFLVTITFLLPLPTLDWLISGLLLALLIAVPITLQPELRRWLEGLGRNRIFSRSRHRLASQLTPPLRKVIEQCAEHKIGALIVLEGQDTLSEVIKTGVRVEGKLSAELLNTIFFDKTPLHDGAVILREDRVIAASCVLPLTQQTLDTYRRLGTRHRAAVGLSEVCDALVIVVSEETGHLSVAQAGKLRERQDVARLQEILAKFYRGKAEKTERRQIGGREIVAGIGRFLLYASFAFLFAILTWGATIERTNPTAEAVLSTIPLRVNGLTDNLAIMNQPPNTVAVTIRTTAALLETLNADSFQAAVLADPSDIGLVRLAVNVTASVANTEILTVQPAEIDVEIVPIITRTLPVDVRISGQETLSAIYELVTVPIVSPNEVIIRGPKPLVDAVRTVQTDVSVANATQAIRRTTELVALGDGDSPIAGITLEPNRAQVTISVQRRQDVREVAINVVTTGTPPEGYWLSGIQVEPVAATLVGDPELLELLTSYIGTLPIEIDAAYGLVEVSVPLAVPTGVQVLDATGAPLQHVQVRLQMSARQGDLLLTRPIQLLNSEGMTVTVSADSVDLLLSGDLPTLREIDANPELVQVTIDAARLPDGISNTVSPVIILPAGVSFQLVNNFIVVTKE
jgi:diadenylate cyclase